MSAEHPAPSTRSRRSVRIASGVFALLCVVVSAIGVRLTDDPLKFHTVHGMVGQPVSIDDAEVTVTDVLVGSRLADQQGVATTRSAGMFVGVDVLIACPGPESRVGGKVQLLAGPRTYPEWESSGAIPPPAGYQSTSRVVFEIDPADLGRLVLEIYAVELISGYPAHAQIDLGLADRADELRTQARDRDVRLTANEQKPIT